MAQPSSGTGTRLLYLLISIICLHATFDRNALVHAADEECGKQAGGKLCPLNVCCSEWGFCGTLSDFCSKTKNCQSNCGTDFKAAHPWKYDARSTVIGYFQTWTLAGEKCAKKTTETNIRLGAVSHVNAAFAYIKPDTYVIHGIQEGKKPPLEDKYYQAVTNIKTRAPKVKVWLSLGGWTFSDNDTVTQPVWSDLSSTEVKRARFIRELDTYMVSHGFDGVDLDWEYPGAPDRRGKPEDTANYVLLCKDINRHFQNRGRGWGLSFTAPASYWYMKWFDIENMAAEVDFVNLMTYDMHGSWDDRSNWIGNKVYTHTNMTEIKDALQLLWRNNVPAEKVNMGLGFYGRSYTLKDPKCDKPGCLFSGPGKAGTCTGQEGYLSYQEIKDILKSTGAKPVHDKETMTKYVRFNNDQWVGYDDPETIKAKVKYANEVGFRGLFIWAIDQDTADFELLSAVLGDKGLDYFGGVGSGSDWDTFTASGCQFSDCGKACGPGMQKVTDVRCADGSGKLRKDLCCPLDGSPDPDFCTWRGYNLGVSCNTNSDSQCNTDEVLVVKDKYYTFNGGDAACSRGKASYCCKTEEVGEKLCNWAGDGSVCVNFNTKDGCEAGQKWVTWRQGNCGRTKVNPYCCSSSVDIDKLACHWTIGGRPNCAPGQCSGSEVKLGTHEGGGGTLPCILPPPAFQKGCSPECVGSTEVQPTLCCNIDALKVSVKKLPVPVANLFFPEDLKNLPPDSVTDFALMTDNTMGGRQQDKGNSDPNSNSFAWYLIDGPANEVTTLDKRQGSGWEVYDCDTELHEERQTARMVCTDDRDSSDSNCHHIFLGEVSATVIRMPAGCGPGKYAMAVSVEPVYDELPPPHINIRNVRRGVKNPPVYKLTFDYDFSILQKRDSKALIRIDYSDNPGYWSAVVSAPGVTKRSMEDIKREIHEDHGGDWTSWLDHTYHMERRATPDHELHKLHERWFSITLDNWITKMKDVETNHTLLRHEVNDIYEYTLFNERRDCQLTPGVPTTLSAKLKVATNIKMQTSAQLTLIGSLGDLSSFKQSHVTLRNKGFITVLLDFEAFGQLRFGSLENEILNVAPLGASISIPGIVTIGPQFKIKVGLEGVMEVHANAKLQVTLNAWDYSQSYPYRGDDPSDGDDLGSKFGDDSGNNAIGNKTKGPQFSYDIGASGMIEAHFTPMVTFGIVWNEKLQVANAAIDFGVDTYGRMFADISYQSGNGLSYCYGADVGYKAFVRAYAPSLFGGRLDRTWIVHEAVKNVIEAPTTCNGGKTSKRGLGETQMPGAWMDMSPNPAMMGLGVFGLAGKSNYYYQHGPPVRVEG